MLLSMKFVVFMVTAQQNHHLTVKNFFTIKPMAIYLLLQYVVLYFFLPIIMLINKKMANYLCAVIFLPSLCVLIMYIFKTGFVEHPNFILDIFYSYYGSIFKHFLLCLLSYMFLFNCSPLSFKKTKQSYYEIGWQIGIVAIYLVYVIVITYIGNALWVPKNRWFYNTTGVFSSAFSKLGDYSFLGKIPYPLNAIGLWMLIFLTGIGTQWIFYILKSKYPLYFKYKQNKKLTR